MIVGRANIKYGLLSNDGEHTQTNRVQDEGKKYHLSGLCRYIALKRATRIVNTQNTIYIVFGPARCTTMSSEISGERK